jgi:response regulator RpfG family c-di-GMP phosphodiesterase
VESAKILVVDDENYIRQLLALGMSKFGHTVLTAEDGVKALEWLARNEVDIVITDIDMPNINGIELILEIIKRGYPCSIIVMTGLWMDFKYAEMIKLGAVDFAQKPISIEEIQIRILRVLKERETITKLNNAIKGFISAITTILERKVPYTAGHQSKVAKLATFIAKKLNLAPDRCQGIYMASLVHNLGKVYIPASILNRPGQLTDLEFSLIKTHPQAGYDTLRKIEFPWPLADIVYQHHEKLDGSGYPQGLTAPDICQEAKILTVADVVEAIVSDRPYRPARGLDAAFAVIEEGKGKKFDPEVVDVCAELKDLDLLHSENDNNYRNFEY